MEHGLLHTLGYSHRRPTFRNPCIALIHGATLNDRIGRSPAAYWNCRCRNGSSSANSAVCSELTELPVFHVQLALVPMECRRSTFVSDVNRFSTHKKHSPSRWSTICKMWKQRHCTYYEVHNAIEGCRQGENKR